MKTITVVTPCFNEEENINDIYMQVKEIFSNLPDFNYKHLFIDNASTDYTVKCIESLIVQDKNVQLIVNNRNFGHIRSPYYGLLQATGDAVILIAADLQEPPGLIKNFIKRWQDGYKVVVGVKNKTQESKIFFTVRKLYYKLVSKVSEIELINNYTGFGLYDSCVIDLLRSLGDPYPYFRGLVSEFGYDIATIDYLQPTRKRGFSKNNFYALYDMAMLGFTSHSKIPLRLITFFGFGLSFFSLVIAFIYLILKLVFWNSFSMGLAPLIIGVFFFGSIQLFFLGVIGEYIAQIMTQVRKRPLVIERKRENMDKHTKIN